MKNMVVLFYDNSFLLIHHNKMVTEVTHKAIEDGFLINKNVFMETFLKVLKREKIRSKLFGETITIVKNITYSNADLFFLESVFHDLGFIKVSFFNIKELLPQDDASFIEINLHNIIFYFDKGFAIPLKYFKDMPLLFQLLKNNLKDNIILFGTNNIIPKIKIPNKNVYYFENYKTYIQESLLKVTKCDA